jgi:AmmeMemoRadiSam system protein A
MPLTNAEKELLLRIARRAVAASATGVPAPPIKPEGRGLREDCGAFVSLYRGGRLRGCVGMLSSQAPLHDTVDEMALAAASKDQRFQPVEASELDSIRVEISVLAPMKEAAGPEEIEVGRHGVYVVKGDMRGVLLPQVAVECGFDGEQFLDQACLKAGLGPGCWKEGAKVFTFEAEVFKEQGGAPGE